MRDIDVQFIPTYCVAVRCAGRWWKFSLLLEKLRARENFDIIAVAIANIIISNGLTLIAEND